MAPSPTIGLKKAVDKTADRPNLSLEKTSPSEPYKKGTLRQRLLVFASSLNCPQSFESKGENPYLQDCLDQVLMNDSYYPFWEEVDLYLKEGDGTYQDHVEHQFEHFQDVVYGSKFVLAPEKASHARKKAFDLKEVT